MYIVYTFTALLLIVLIVYIFAIIFLNAIVHYVGDLSMDDEGEHKLAHEMGVHFGNVYETMVSLFCSVTGGISIFVWCLR